jgi:C4-dicarboxylate-specific signal transduction histidine kinase
MSRRSRLPATGERELDRIVTALNEAGRRLSDARQQADQLARKIATGERLAAIGRVAAGVAHEIRDPIAAMRLKAENAMAGAAERKSEALSFILGQIERLAGCAPPRRAHNNNFIRHWGSLLVVKIKQKSPMRVESFQSR